MVATLLLLQFVITLIRPPVERWLFYGADREDVARLHLLEERLLTTGDLRQFLEFVLNAACDVTGAPGAFIAALGPGGLDLEVAVGRRPTAGVRAAMYRRCCVRRSGGRSLRWAPSSRGRAAG